MIYNYLLDYFDVDQVYISFLYLRLYYNICESVLVVNYWYGYIILMDLIKFLENIFVEFYNLLKYNFN